MFSDGFVDLKQGWLEDDSGKEAEVSDIMGKILLFHSRKLELIDEIKDSKKAVWLVLSFEMKNLIKKIEELSCLQIEHINELITEQTEAKLALSLPTAFSPLFQKIEKTKQEIRAMMPLIDTLSEEEQDLISKIKISD